MGYQEFFIPSRAMRQMSEKERNKLIRDLQKLMRTFQLESYVVHLSTAYVCIASHMDTPEAQQAYRTLDGFALGYLMALGFDKNGRRR